MFILSTWVGTYTALRRFSTRGGVLPGDISNMFETLPVHPVNDLSATVPTPRSI
ncbi:hypothetical protein NDI76_22025 [Halogeometricum sp. S1BR25-6]|uniref:Uncharacterized protein n=1 Tax=Halogeometricum salsisoli TaxID=2950536 RepID=A0ABU2GKR2_9EURY|nr:hypothetical protein [Halogeometricum sp. S1BR25-6]MDS0301411.1 hypothetical protein [Halogeometricum sp. S1BR25-6]